MSETGSLLVNKIAGFCDEESVCAECEHGIGNKACFSATLGRRSLWCQCLMNLHVCCVDMQPSVKREKKRRLSKRAVQGVKEAFFLDTERHAVAQC